MGTPIRWPLRRGVRCNPPAEALELTKTLKLPRLRWALSSLIPTAKAQRWAPADVVSTRPEPHRSGEHGLPDDTTDPLVTAVPTVILHASIRYGGKLRVLPRLDTARAKRR